MQLSFSTLDQQEYIKNIKIHNTSAKRSGKANGSNYLKDDAKGYISYLCPSCSYEVRGYEEYHMECRSQISSINQKYPSSHVRIEKIIELDCPRCTYKGKFIEVDPNIGPIISMLNQKGYYTKYCCDGHGYQSPYVSFQVRNPKIILFLDTLPIEWYLAKNDLTQYGGIVIRAVNKNEWKESLYILYQWVKALPDLPMGKVYSQNMPLT